MHGDDTTESFLAGKSALMSAPKEKGLNYESLKLSNIDLPQCFSPAEELEPSSQNFYHFDLYSIRRVLLKTQKKISFSFQPKDWAN
jgi:hypothetical protein